MPAQTDTSRRLAILTGLLVLTGLLLQSILTGGFGQIGPDSDDLMRLLQVQDYRNGQGWFDPAQYRLGVEGGTVMHWSRLVDIPLIALTGFLDLFLDTETAEKWAITIWPPICAIGLVYGLWRGLKNVPGRYTQVFGAMIIVLIFARFYRFLPGAIDHHNLQLLLLAIALGFAADPAKKTRSYAIAGVACGLSIAIGIEVAVFVGVFCAYFAVNWLILGERVAKATVGFGLAFGVTLLASFFLTVGPQNYGLIYCDAFSVITVTAGCLGGFGLAIVALLCSGRSMSFRLIGLAALGTTCGALFLIQGPQCLSNPLSDLSPVVKALWLDEVVEAQSLSMSWAESRAETVFTISIQVVAMFVILWLLKRGEDKNIFGLHLALIVTALLFSIYQVRFYAFGFIFAIVPLARWIGLLFEKKKTPGNEGSVGYIFAIAASLPFVWAAPFVVLDKPEPNAVEGQAAACFSDRVYDTLNALPAGALLANPNAGPRIIDRTLHRAINGNYHRNIAGIELSIDIFTSPPVKAGALLKENDIDYMHFCRTTRETRVNADYAPNGLVGHMLEGDIPNYLEPVGPDLENGAVTIFKVRQ